MLERLGFRIIHATSEDPRFLGTELEHHGPGVNGWRSGKGAAFPQELILQLESRSRLGFIQLLAHQYAIPETMELFIGDSPHSHNNGDLNPLDPDGGIIDLSQVHFLHLGRITLSTNQSTGFKARELKSLTVKCSGSFVKLLINKGYRNKYNRDHQVAIVALNLLGERLEEDEVDEALNNSRSHNQLFFEEAVDRDRSLFSPFDDISFTMYVDVEVQDIIRKMDLKKMEAVLDERFDYASKLKASMEHLRKSGELLAKYQLEKMIAAGREDFEKAKEKKEQMDTLRDSLYKNLRVKELLEPNGRIAENDEPGLVLGVAGMTRSITELSLPPDISMMSIASTPESTTSGRFSLLTTPDCEKRENGYLSQDEPKLPPLFHKKRRPQTQKKALQFSSIPVPVPASASEKKDREKFSTSPAVTSSNGDRAAVSGLTLPRQEPLVKEEPCLSCINRPSNITERARRYAALPIQVFGETLVEKIFSKNFAVKEDGLRCLHKTLSDYKKGDKNNPPSKVFRAAHLLLQRTIKDTISSVFHLTAEALTYLLDDFARKHRLAGSELAQALERILPELLSKSGDTALGKNKVAVECILKLQASPHLRNLHVISSHLTKPLDTPVHPRLAQSKAEMVEELLKTYGLSAEKNSGLTARDYVEFAASALTQPSESVRRVAERITLTMYGSHPKLVRQNLPLEEDISRKNVQYRQIFQQFDKVDKERKDGSSIAILKEVKAVQNSMSTSMTSSVYIPKI